MVKRLKPSCYQLKFHHIRSDFYTDTMFSKVKSLHSNTCWQTFCSSVHLIKLYLMQKIKEAHMALTKFHHEVGVPPNLITDGHPVLTEGQFARKARGDGSYLRTTEPYTWKQNLAEARQRELKRIHQRAVLATNSPTYLWDHCLVLQTAIRNNTTVDIYDLNGKVPKNFITGETGLSLSGTSGCTSSPLVTISKI